MTLGETGDTLKEGRGQIEGNNLERRLYNFIFSFVFVLILSTSLKLKFNIQQCSPKIPIWLRLLSNSLWKQIREVVKHLNNPCI